MFSAAVIGHIGSLKSEKNGAECFRVCKKGVFITTPMWHPIEVHTLLPLLHWFPKRIHRYILNKFGMKFYARGRKSQSVR